MLSSRLSFVLVSAVIGCGGSSADFNEPLDAGSDTASEAGPGAGIGTPCSTAGALSCQGVAQKLQLICDGTKWVSNGTCSGEMVCDPRPGATLGTCQAPVCRAGTNTCDGATLKACSPELLSFKTSTCADAEHCRQSVGGVCAQCLAWEVRCDGAKLLKCAPDRQKMVTVATCESAGLCNAFTGTCRDPVCAAGEFRCLGDLLETCAEDRASFMTVKLCPPGTCDATLKDCRG
jgi:hypothetical protein